MAECSDFNSSENSVRKMRFKLDEGGRRYLSCALINSERRFLMVDALAYLTLVFTVVAAVSSVAALYYAHKSYRLSQDTISLDIKDNREFASLCVSNSGTHREIESIDLVTYRLGRPSYLNLVRTISLPPATTVSYDLPYREGFEAGTSSLYIRLIFDGGTVRRKVKIRKLNS